MIRLLTTLVALLAMALPAIAQEDTSSTPTFNEGDVITIDQIEKLKPFLPPEFWANRDFFFYEGMQLEVGPSFADYSPAPVYKAATEKFAGQPSVGPESSLQNYVAGQPFPMENIDCKGDPEAGAKIAWNFMRRWAGAGGSAQFYYSYWDRGEELPLYYEGNSRGVSLGFRPEPAVRLQPSTDLALLDIQLQETSEMVACLSAGEELPLASISDLNSHFASTQIEGFYLEGGHNQAACGVRPSALVISRPRHPRRPPNSVGGRLARIQGRSTLCQVVASSSQT